MMISKPHITHPMYGIYTGYCIQIRWVSSEGGTKLVINVKIVNNCLISVQKIVRISRRI